MFRALARPTKTSHSWLNCRMVGVSEVNLAHNQGVVAEGCHPGLKELTWMMIRLLGPQNLKENTLTLLCISLSLLFNKARYLREDGSWLSRPSVL